MKKTAEWWEIYADMLDLPDGQWQQRLQACAEACSNSYSLHLYRQCAKKAVSIEDFFMALAEAFADMDLVRELRTGVNMKHAISNSFAFGGSNACVLLSDCAE